MASPHKDVEYMRCMHCQKVIRISRCDTSGLVRHVELDHPSKCTVPSKKCKEPPSSVTSQMSEKAEQCKMYLLWVYTDCYNFVLIPSLREGQEVSHAGLI